MPSLSYKFAFFLVIYHQPWGGEEKGATVVYWAVAGRNQKKRNPARRGGKKKKKSRRKRAVPRFALMFSGAFCLRAGALQPIVGLGGKEGRVSAARKSSIRKSTAFGPR